MGKADIKKKIHLASVALIFYIQKGTAFSTNVSALTSCASSTANISFDFSINAGETIFETTIWFFGAGKIAESNGTTLTPVPSYSSRLTAYGTSGISLSNITVADAGRYTYVIVRLPTGIPATATTVLSVQVAPLAPPSGCQVSSWNQPGNIPTCAVNTNNGNCGTPSLIASLVNSTNTTCNVGETYQCCATSAALTCYSGSPNDFCKLFTCTDVTTTTTTATTVSTTNTEMRTTSIYMTTRSTEIGTTQSTEITTLCPLPVVVIVAITFSGILSILLIIIICCCCCPCCCLYHCRMEQNTDTNGKKFVETNGRDAQNRTETKVETQNPAYAMSDETSKSSTFL